MQYGICSDSGARLLFIDSMLDTGFMDDEMIISVVSSIAEVENESRAKNIRMGYQFHAADGTYGLYQRKCYGYEKNAGRGL